jgi:hypothetical protein
LFPELGVDDPIVTRERFVTETMPRVLVADAGGTIAGYALFDVMAETGYVRNIVSAPDQRRTGVGVALMTAMRDRFVAAGATQWCLNVKPGNVAAIALYERFGFAPQYRSAAVRLPVTIELPPVAPDTQLVPIPADADPIVEPRLKLLRGQLAAARARPSRHVLQLVRGDELLGAGVFLATIPGAFPCRLVAPEHAAAMFARLRELAPPEATFMQIGVEDDEPMRAEVLRLGAYVNLEILHMHGSLPP